MKRTTSQIPIARPVFGEEEMRAIQRPLESGWVVQGPFVREFETKFAQFVGAPEAVASSNGTTALHLAVAALGLRSGDEVIVPAFTWVATANVVEYMGARPVFCDIDMATFNLDTTSLKACVTDRTVGIIPVHLFGLCADMNPIVEFAREHDLWIVEDAACAFGAWYHDRHAGTIGQVGCFSFHPRKSITTGEGGMLTTADTGLADRARSLRNHGVSNTEIKGQESVTSYLLPDHDLLGYNYRMTDLQGALGSVQMNRAGWILEQRTRCAAFYDHALADIDELALPITPSGLRHGYQSYVCLYCPEPPTLDNVDRLHQQRNRLMAALEDDGIATRPGTHAPIAQRFYAHKYGIRPEEFPRAFLADRLSLALPLYPQMTEEVLQTVAAAVRRRVAESTR